MLSSNRISLSALAALLSVAAAGFTNSTICYSYGVDFVDEGEYFINSLSSDPFTAVSTFEGCQPGKAEVLLVDPNSDESFCSQLDTTPDNTPALSTCPVLKSQMFSGHWIFLVLGNNGDGEPFAWQRDLYLDVGPQETVTIVPTVTFSVTTTPVVTVSSTITITSTLSATATRTLPSATRVKTITPKPSTTTETKTYTKTFVSWTKQLSYTTKTVTASCTLPPWQHRPDKPCEYRPTLIRPAALATPTGKARLRFARKADRAVDIEYARRRIEAAKLKRDRKAREASGDLQERAPDAPTITTTASIPVNTTTTVTASPITEQAFFTTTTSLQAPDVTVFYGVLTSTTTLPAVTKTRRTVVYTKVSTTKTATATFTRTTHVTPSALVTECKKKGGHIGPGRL